MGCNPSKQQIYSVTEDQENNDTPNKQDFYIHPEINDFNSFTSQYKDHTVVNEIMKNLEANPNQQALGYRKPIDAKTCEKKFTYNKYSEIRQMAISLSKNLMIQELCPSEYFQEEGNFSFLGIFGRNCMEWLITDLACQLNGITSVTFYATLGEVAFDFISEQTKISTICVSPDNVKLLCSYIQKYNINSIKNVVLFDYSLFLPEECLTMLQDIGLKVCLFSELIKPNDLHENLSLNPAKPEDILTLCYTSGTTGIPKGAKITQNNLANAIFTIFDSAEVSYGLNDSILIYLPLAHIMERMNSLATLVHGLRTGFISGDVRTSLSEDLEIFAPTVMIAVPRVLQLFRTKILDQFNNLPEGCAKNTALKALRTKRENYEENGSITHAVYDKLVFSKVRAKFGGNIKYFVTGSAPITKEVAMDIKVIFSCPLIEGYGLTETCAATSICNFNDPLSDHCGGPLKGIRIKLVDVPEMNYDSKTLWEGDPSPTGEICIYGPPIFKGYFQNPEATQNALDSDGWFHTGDIGRIMPNHRGLRIIDRKKEIFKLAQGEYIAPSKLESVYSKSQWVSSICIYGNSFKTFIVGIIVPNRETVLKFLNRKGISDAKELKDVENIEQHFKNPDMIAEIKAEFDAMAKEASFNSLEKIGKFFLCNREFSIQNGCLTATLKLARNVIFKEFEKEIDELYA